MPYWFETKKLRVGKDKDRRRKLFDEDKQSIKELYKNGFAIREIARIFENKCCRRSIQFVLFPERLPTKEYRKENNYFYNRKKHNKYMKKHRRHLKEIYGLKKNRCKSYPQLGY